MPDPMLDAMMAILEDLSVRMERIEALLEMRNENLSTLLDEGERAMPVSATRRGAAAERAVAGGEPPRCHGRAMTETKRPGVYRCTAKALEGEVANSRGYCKQMATTKEDGSIEWWESTYD